MKKKVRVCQGHACVNNMAQYTLERAVNEAEFNKKVEVEQSGCQGRCAFGPCVTVEGKEKVLHTKVDAVEVGKIIDKIR